MDTLRDKREPENFVSHGVTRLFQLRSENVGRKRIVNLITELMHLLLCVLFSSKGTSKWTAFIQRSSNQWPLEVLYNTAEHSPIQAHIHTLTASSAVQGDSQLIVSSQGEVPCSRTPQHPMLGGAGD